jgi:hypothetical protein
VKIMCFQLVPGTKRDHSSLFFLAAGLMKGVRRVTRFESQQP